MNGKEEWKRRMRKGGNEEFALGQLDPCLHTSSRSEMFLYIE